MAYQKTRGFPGIQKDWEPTLRFPPNTKTLLEASEGSRKDLNTISFLS